MWPRNTELTRWSHLEIIDEKEVYHIQVFMSRIFIGKRLLLKAIKYDQSCILSNTISGETEESKMQKWQMVKQNSKVQFKPSTRLVTQLIFTIISTQQKQSAILIISGNIYYNSSLILKCLNPKK